MRRPAPDQAYSVRHRVYRPGQRGLATAISEQANSYRPSMRSVHECTQLLAIRSTAQSILYFRRPPSVQCGTICTRLQQQRGEEAHRRCTHVTSEADVFVLSRKRTLHTDVSCKCALLEENDKTAEAWTLRGVRISRRHRGAAAWLQGGQPGVPTPKSNCQRLSETAEGLAH